MRRLLIALLFVFASLPVAGVNTVVVMRHAAAGGAFCDGTFQFCESAFADLTNFDATTAIGTWSVSGGHVVGPTSGVGMLFHDTAAGGATQYAIVRLDTLAGNQGVFLRGNSAGGFNYTVYRTSTVTYWSVSDNFATWVEDIGYCTIAWSAGDYMLASVSGTGATTIFKIWKETTMPTAAPSGTADCTFTGGTGATSAGDGSAAECQIPANLCSPVQACDTGTKVGIHCDTGASGANWDDFAAGGS